MVVDAASDNRPTASPRSPASGCFRFAADTGNARGILLQNASGRSQRDALAGAVEQAKAQLVFQILDLHCHRRLR